MGKTIIISLGGSVIVPDKIDVTFLKEFKDNIEMHVSRGCKFVIYTGGGRIARDYQNAASQIAKLSDEDLDWIGIYATRLNAQLIKSIFKNKADGIILNPNDNITFKKNIIVAAGWLPGWSTDYDAVLVAKNIKSKEIINMSNVNYIYDKDPKKFNGAKPFYNLTWQDYRSLIATKWSAGLNAPFDPIAAKEAEKLKIKVVLLGRDLKNFEDYINKRKFEGTVIE